MKARSRHGKRDRCKTAHTRLIKAQRQPKLVRQVIPVRMISFMSREEIQEKMIADSELPLEIAQVQAPLNDFKPRGNDKYTDPLPMLPSP